MKTTTAPIPKKVLSRKDEITADFMKLYHDHLDVLFAGKSTHRMTTSMYAEKLFIHPRHLTNTLKLTTGKSPCEFMETAIADEVCRLLLQTDLSVSEISTLMAWDEPTNFVKFFKGMTGETPLQFRKKRLM
ncbi:AraC family transcriptional regulator [Flavobacterium sp. MAH-1]|uniref:AraC family transcriptional regulator n=1 Tax=Flavobacterium agri TaxID=2743471 RepID=A0A7Y9C8N3_9FLAO|nr:helix-turn-helix domain-containing protein [Flavobacterium agri]NUY82640.1 AraC family transcriptional regulator [Flavobacterium agri]NYA72663.1 AraC family transcriptional regulator [Flavobacterium agri]